MARPPLQPQKVYVSPFLAHMHTSLKCPRPLRPPLAPANDSPCASGARRLQRLEGILRAISQGGPLDTGSVSEAGRDVAQLRAQLSEMQQAQGALELQVRLALLGGGAVGVGGGACARVTGY